MQATITNKTDFSSSFNSSSFSDFHFEFLDSSEYPTLYAHKVILNQNEYFKSLFQTKKVENKMKINDDPTAFSLLIKTLYVYDLTLSFKTTGVLLLFINLADKYQFINVRNTCCDLLSNNILKENCGLIWHFCINKDYLTEISKKATLVLRQYYFFEIKTETFVDDISNMVTNMNAEELKLFLGTFITANVKVNVIWSIILKWAEFDQKTRASHVLPILQIIEKKKISNSQEMEDFPCNMKNVYWLSNNSPILRKFGITNWQCYFGSERFNAYQTVQFSLKIEQFMNQSINRWGVIIGIATDDHPNDTWLGSDCNGYGFIGLTGEKNHNSANGLPYTFRMLKSGDVFTVSLPGDGTVEFLINGESLGNAFENLPRNVLFRPAASVCCFSISLEFVQNTDKTLEKSEYRDL